ncbi:MAG: PP2C family protein-serine/threonine phosphatase [Vicinamibacterales bacterium]
MPSTASPPQEPKLFHTLGRDVRDVVVDVHRTGFRATIRGSLSRLETFYLSAEHQGRLAGMGRAKRFLFRSWWLLKSLYFKLNPARRILLLIAFLLMWNGRTDMGSGRVRVQFDVGFIGVALLLVILMLELKDKLVAKSELEAGRTVQLALMPNHAPELRGWDIWLYTRSANDVGGDLVDYLPVAADRLGIMLGDVAGKGLPAALLMAKLQATLRALISAAGSLSELGAETNRILNRDGLPNRFATLVYLEIAPDSGHVRLLNAGHMPPIVLRGGGIEEIRGTSIALGMMPEAAFAEQHTDLDIGDVLVVYSDGITEAMDTADDFYGDDRLRAALIPARTNAAADAGKAILASVDAFVGAAAVHDDMSLVILKRV